MKKWFKIIALILCCILLLPGSALADAAIGGAYNYQSADFYVVVDAPDGYVNFRYGPGLEYGINFPIYNGEILYISSTADNYYDDLWWGQTQYNGQYGWISLSQTSFMEVPSSEPVYEYADQYNMVDAWDGYCNLRVGPGISYEIITPIYNGEVLHVTTVCYNPEDGLYWGYTEYKIYSGWISLSQTTEVSAPQPDKSEYLVSDAYYAEDNIGVYAIPTVHLNSAEIQTLNNALYAKLYPQIQDALAGVNPVEGLMSTTYTWNLNGDILSLVIGEWYGGPWHEYEVYNISVSGQKLLNDTAVIGAAGYTETEYLQMARSAMEQRFINRTQVLQDQESEMFKNAYNKAYNETMSQDNIAASKPFLNGKGELCIIANIGLVLMQNSFSWDELNLVSPYLEDEYRNFYVIVNGPAGYTDLKTLPGPLGDHIAFINNGQKIFISLVSQYDGDNSLWGETYYNGQHGWISMSEVRE